ncbi:sodium-coupled monocarboxylate transporter 1-like [Lytechinus variegatus]|uniref:sodium-coupled monocarboxylate transporter 1-like n=1 Tax=Lytechinus variegatus TaxID=7654 RepID=UPI001BB1334B|nr:sodium-coupled monocarboxylate transporter 1-like [Lytechinus variegatus]
MPEDGQSELTFQTADFVVWSFILASSVGIGIYYACTGGRQQSTEEFLVGNRNMNPIPVAMSLAVSFVSAVMFLGMTSEAYGNGVMVWLQGVGIFISAVIISISFLPIFHRLNVTSANEYLERRFNRTCRLLGSVILIFNMFVYMGVVLYAPSLALNQVAGLNVWGSVLTVGLACTFYTTIGGLKAVIWTDVFQMCIMISGLLAVIIKGSSDLGGFSNVLRIVDEGNRLDLFEFSTDVTVRHTFWGPYHLSLPPSSLFSTNVTVRHTFWGLTIGSSFMFLSIFGINQAQVQRYVSCHTVKIARISLALGTAIMLFLFSSAVTAGLVMYAYYADCDPISSGAVAKRDQMMPYFTLDLFQKYPGLPGLFLSAVFSASLSTISSGLNAVAAVTTEDLIKPIWPGLSDERYTQLSKLMALSYGILTIGFAFIASFLGDILSTVLNFFSMFGGPTLGLFSVGMFFPWTNSKGAFCGTLIGLVFSFWIGIGAQVYPSPYPAPPFSTSGCVLYNDTSDLYNSNDLVSNFTKPTLDGATTVELAVTSEYPALSVDERPAIAALYKLAYTWYASASWLVTVFAALLISFLTGATDPKDIDPRLICPVVDVMYCCLPEKWKVPLRCGVGADFIKEIEYDGVIEKETKANQNLVKNGIQVDRKPEDEIIEEIV